MELILGSKKALGLLTLAGLLVVASLFAISAPFQTEQNVLYWFWGILLLAVTLVALSLSSIFPYGPKTFMAVAALCSASILGFFPWHGLQILNVLVVTAGIMLMKRSIQRTEKESLHFSFYRSVHGGMTLFLIGIIFAMALTVYVRAADSLGRDPEVFYRNMAATVVEGVKPILELKIQGFTPEMTLDEFLINGYLFGVPDLTENASLSNTRFEPRNSQQLALIRDNFLKTFGVQAEGGEQIVDVLNRIVSVRIEQIFAPVQGFLPLIYAFIVFLSLRLLVPLVVWLAGFFGSLAFKFLVRTNFIRMAEKTVTVEIPELT